MPNKGLGILILAAGKSSRMGGPKQLLPWKGKTLLGHVIANSLALTKNVFVVLGAYKEAVQPTISKNVLSVFNPDWELGMGSSIAMGTKRIQEKCNPERLLILLADQPLVDVAYLQKMLAQKKPIVATTYHNNFGVPALFDACFFEELKGLNKHYGAKMLLKENTDKVLGLDAGHKNVDLDTPENYEHFFRLYGEN